MSDLIERSAVKRELNAQYAVARSTENPDAVEQVLREVSKAVDSIPAASRWIPVEEALPEFYERVLTADIDGYVAENYRLNIRGGELAWSKGFRITHWRQLPGPPKVERG